MTKFYSVKKHCWFINFIFLSLFMTACSDNTSSEPVKQVISLNNNNIDHYSMKVADDYIEQLDLLLSGFDQAKKNDDADAFNDFRNKQWTAEYADKKHTYSEIYLHNQDFLKNNQAAAQLFILYDELIYISLDLKHGIRESNQKLLDATINKAKADRQKTLDLVIYIASH